MANRKRSSSECRTEQHRQAVSPTGSRDLARYQEELAVQSEALREVRSELEETRDRFTELYDFAPSGYLTLDGHGVILRINLTGAAWLGRNKAALEGMPLLVFIKQGSRERFVDFMRLCRGHRESGPLTLDLRLRGDGGTRDVQLLCRPGQNSRRAPREFFTAMIDMTAHRQLIAEREHALQQRAAYAGRVISIQEEERQRIARDLHDSVGQLVTGLRLTLDALEVVHSDGLAFQRRLADARAIGHRLDEAVDFMAAELRPASLDFGLAAALEQFVREWSRTFGLEATLHAKSAAGLRMAPAVEAHLYRVAQEALHNVYKHARATSVHVTLERRVASVRLTVEDDGIGLEASDNAKERGRGWGLAGMRERVQLIEGSLAFTRGSTGGTRIVVECPLADAR